MLLIKQIESDLNLPVIEGEETPESLLTCSRMIDVADYIGRASAAIQQRQGDTAQGVDLQASFIVGGQVPGEDPEMYLIYPQGNYITYSPNQPFLQLGETKYGKPILDRIITPNTRLEDAARCALVSMDSTVRSNASVGLPVDLVVYRKGSFRLEQELTFTEDDEFFREMRSAWSTGLMEAFMKLPHFDWERAQPQLQNQPLPYGNNVRAMPTQR